VGKARGSRPAYVFHAPRPLGQGLGKDLIRADASQARATHRFLRRLRKTLTASIASHSPTRRYADRVPYCPGFVRLTGWAETATL
jgi:hypothetical protein